MASKNVAVVSPEEIAEPVVESPEAKIGRMIADGIAAGFEKLSPRKKVTFGEYIARQPKRTGLLRPFFQNGYEVQAYQLHQLPGDPVALINQIHRSGRYLDRKVEVIVRNEGRDLADQSVELRYSNKTQEQRIDNAKLGSSLTDWLVKIVAEQTALDADDEARGFKPRR